jgi:hypothetical protein
MVASQSRLRWAERAHVRAPTAALSRTSQGCWLLRALRYVTSAITALALALARARASTYVARPDATAIAPASLCPLSLLLLPAIPPHSAPRPPPAAFGN